MKSFSAAARAALCLVLMAASLAAASQDTAVQPTQQRASPAAQSLRVVRVTPSGVDVQAERQIVIQFNRPVVPLGRMERDQDEIPIAIEPALDCQWRWLDTTALACQLDAQRRLSRATRYEVRIRPGIRTEDGATLSEPLSFDFITQRPTLSYASFVTWRGPSLPVLRVVFNQEVYADSVRAHLHMRPNAPDAVSTTSNTPTEQGNASVPLQIVASDELGYKVVRGQASAQESALALEALAKPARIWLVMPEVPLPRDSTVSLDLQPGLRGSAGPEQGTGRDDVIRFDTFPQISFIGVSCTDVYSNKTVLIKPDTPIDAQPRCDPLQTYALQFSAPVLVSTIRQQVRFTPDLTGGRKNFDPWQNRSDYSRLNQAHQRGRTYAVRLPVYLRAFQVYTIAAEPNSISDEFGRLLSGAIDMPIMTAHRRPAFKLPHEHAVLERHTDSDLPVYITNLDTLELSYRRLHSDGPVPPRSLSISVPKPIDIAFAHPLGVRALLEGRSGAISGRLSSQPRDRDGPQRNFFAQVSPFQVLVKIGHFSSLAWVTDMRSGQPVIDAQIRIYKDRYKTLGGPGPTAFGPFLTDADGIARLPGSDQLDPKLVLLNEYAPQAARLFAQVRKGGEMGLLPLDSDFHLWADGVYAQHRQRLGHLRAWGTTAQGVYRVGDTIEYKLYVRQQDTHTLVPAPADGYKLSIIDPKGEPLLKDSPLTLSEFGAFADSIEIPKSSPVGWYRFELTRTDSDIALSVLRVLVADFTPSPFKVRATLNGDAFKTGDMLDIDIDAQLHAGGPFTSGRSRTLVRLQATALRSEHPLAKGFFFDTSTPDHHGWQTLLQHEHSLDEHGKQTVNFTLPESQVLYGRLQVEGSVLDDRGKRVAALAAARFHGRDRFVGVRNTKWIYHEQQPATVAYLVVDSAGTPVTDTPVDIKIERKQTYAARVKSAGNAYVTRFEHSWVEIARCTGEGQHQPGSCVFTPDQAGAYRSTASIVDSHGRAHSTTLHAWVVGQDTTLWEEAENSALQIVPEKIRHQVGDTARYMIRNPLPGALALITIERYGVLRSWTQRFDSSTPVVEFEVEPDFLPGFYLSVSLVSARVAAPLPERGRVDLGKPASRYGYVRVPVDDPYKMVDVKVQPERSGYKPREVARVQVQAQSRHPVPGPLEFAVAVLDESVLDLIAGGSKYFDPYEGFYALGPLDVSSFSLLERLVGRQKFQTKGNTQGGDGAGADDLRSLFKFVSYWNPSIRADAEGKASFEFQVPDNLTGWRVLVLAATPGDRLGLGQGSFKVSKPTELRPVMPNQVSEGDRFMAGFSVMNRTDRSRTLEVSLHASGLLDYSTASAPDTAPAPTNEPHRKRVTRQVVLAPFKRETVFIELQAGKVDPVKAGYIQLEAHAEDTLDGDRVVHRLAVKPRRSLLSAATYGSIDTDEPLHEPIDIPAAIHPDSGEISVTLSPTVLGNITGAFEYMRTYPYDCWEQKLSKAVMASHYQRLRKYLPSSLIWPESAALPAHTLALARRYQAPNGGMAYWLAEDKRVSPYLSAYTALAFEWLREAGHELPVPVLDKLHTYLQALLRNERFPDFYNPGMASSVRAVALAALGRAGKLDADSIERYLPHLPQMSLFGQIQMLDALHSVGELTAPQAELIDHILARGVQSGGKLQLNESLDSRYAQILSTPLRSNCAALSIFSTLAHQPAHAARLGDLPLKLTRAIVQSRGNRDHFRNTQENLFCAQALAHYADRYEPVTPRLEVTATVDGAPLGKAVFETFTDPAQTLARPITAGDPGTLRTLTLQRLALAPDTPTTERDEAIERSATEPGAQARVDAAIDEGTPRAETATDNSASAPRGARVYYSARLRYAPLHESAERINAGIDIRREYSVERDGGWQLLRSPMRIKRGELVRVDLYLSLPTARHFVVVDDPVPGGVEPVNQQLATASVIDAEKGRFSAAAGSWWYRHDDWERYGFSYYSFYHKELRFDAARFFSDYLPAGNYHLSYTAQAIAPGSFTVQPVHAEEMYDPDVFGKGLPAQLLVTQ